MKQKSLLALCIVLFLAVAGMAQTTVKTETIKVYGNCGMCKTTIESALKKKHGVVSKSWDQATQTLTVTYDTSKITIQQIGEKVANVGYDNEYATAPDEKYNQLHGCCKYQRPAKQ